MVVVVSTVMVTSSVTVSTTRTRLARGVADTRVRREEMVMTLEVFILDNVCLFDCLSNGVMEMLFTGCSFWKCFGTVLVLLEGRE